MKKTNKLALIISVFLTFALVFSACSSKEEIVETKEEKNEAEINAKYEDIIDEKSQEEELLPEDYNPILNNFTTVDFQFTMTDDTLAFNLAENSYTKITPAGAAFGFHDNNLPADYFQGSFKNAKGVSIASAPSELIASYKLGEGNYFTGEDGSITFAFATDGSYEFSTLSSADAQKVKQIYTDAVASLENGAQAVMDEFSDYTTLALVCIASTPEGVVSEFAMYRFDKV